MIDTGEGNTADVSRDHAVVESGSGVLSVIGGKLTEYRYMAERARPGGGVARAQRGGAGRGTCRWSVRPGQPGIDESCCGAAAKVVAGALRRRSLERLFAAATCERPTEAVADGIDVTRAEFEYAVTHEGALTADDILDRRTGSAWWAPAAERVAAVAAEFVAG